MKKVYGVGINDVKGISRKEKAYTVWMSMLSRCYSDSYKKLRPTYEGCIVCNDWLYLSNFKEWMDNQDHDGRQLDKDIVKPGNKIYCPEYCRFISPALNSLLTLKSKRKSKYGVGVFKSDSAKNSYKAQCSVNGKVRNIGTYSTPEEAQMAYREFKSNLIMLEAARQDDKAIAEGLRLHAEIILNKQ